MHTGLCFPSTGEVPESWISRLWSQRGQQLPDGWRGCVWLHERLWVGRRLSPQLPENRKVGQSYALLQRWAIAHDSHVIIASFKKMCTKHVYLLNEVTYMTWFCELCLSPSRTMTQQHAPTVSATRGCYCCLWVIVKRNQTGARIWLKLASDQ